MKTIQTWSFIKFERENSFDYLLVVERSVQGGEIEFMKTLSGPINPLQVSIRMISRVNFLKIAKIILSVLLMIIYPIDNIILEKGDFIPSSPIKKR